MVDMHIKHSQRLFKKIKPMIGAYTKYVLSISDGPNKGIHQPRWRGIRVSKFPSDLILYSEIIWERRPDYIIEAGTRFGGSAAFFADTLAVTGGRKVITIDINPKLNQLTAHPRIEFIVGSSTDKRTFDIVSKLVDGGKVMISLDSDHRDRHVLNELNLWAPLVSVGQYLVVEDAWDYNPEPKGPYIAMEKFLAKNTNFERMPVEEKYIVGVTRDGWLLKKRP